MQKIKDFIYYNRKEILLVIISIIGILCLLLKSDDTSVIEENNLSIKEIPITEEKETKKIIVDIKGEINNPGTYEMDYDERIIDVINKSGGLTNRADVNNINLSERVKDEMVIIVPSIDEKKEEKENKQEKDNKSSSNYVITKKEEPIDKKVSINTANIQTLMTLSGIGEKKAEAIIEYRSKNGYFKSIEEIMNVSGIGKSIFEKIKDFIKV